jgi:homoserine dehydrogenase
MHHKPLTIGLFGFGVVGQGLHKVLLQTPSLNTKIKKICIKNPGKKRNAPAGLFTTDGDELLNDPDINVIVEVINESGPAFQIVATALRNGKDVVSAGKKMIAEHLPELLALQKETGRSFLYEAAACASIPVIRNLEEYYDNDLLQSIRAIVNGSTNFILSKMFEEQLSFKDSLMLTQQMGFAEKDPALDVEGYDAIHKWSFLLTHAYGIMEKFDNIIFNGIQHIQLEDARVAAEKNYQIKLVAQAQKLNDGKIAAFVLPQFIRPDDPLAFVKNEFNGVVIESHFADKQFFYGKGAGSLPTASAVLSDISALRYAYKYEYRKLHSHLKFALSNDFYLRVYVRFTDWEFIPREKFTWIDEQHSGAERNYLTGVIHFSALCKNTWWKENDTSMILLPDPVEERVEIRKLKTRSLELGGVV